MVILSTFFLLLSILFFFKSQQSKQKKIIYIVLFVFNSIGIVIDKAITTFGENVTYDEFFFHLLVENKEIIRLSVEYPIILYGSIFFIICLLIFVILVSKCKIVKFHIHAVKITYLAILFATITNPFIQETFLFIRNFKNSENIFAALTIKDLGDGSFGKHYRIPKITEVAEKRNFVFIYLEGFDYGYFDESRFPDLLPNLQKIASKSTVFNNIEQLPGGGSTITGMVSSQCGIPLLTPGIGYAYSARQFGSFLPNATCLGDLLQEQGYDLSFYGGAEKTFSNKDLFLSSHGFNTVYGKNELAKNLPEDYEFSKWGVHDDALFNQIIENVTTIKEEAAIGIFALTVDTHVPRGHIPESCTKNYTNNEDPLLDAVTCTDQLVGEFVKKLQNTTFGKDAVVIIASDHVSQTSRLQKDTERRNTLLVYDPRNEESRVISNKGSTLDTGTTLLPFIGIQGEIGLGRNVSRKNIEEHEIISKKINRWRNELMYFWDIREKLEGDITISKELATITLNKQTYETPALIVFFDENTYKLHLPKYKGGRDFLKMAEEENYLGYIIIDDCNRLYKEKNRWTESGNHKCLNSTPLKETQSGFYIQEEITLSSEDLFRFE